jgi:hypothetical protein
MCFTQKSFSEIYDTAYTVKDKFGVYHPSRKSCNDGAGWLLRELCDGGLTIDGKKMKRENAPVPQSSMRLKRFMEVTTLKQFHRYWDGVMRKANHDPVTLSRQRWGPDGVIFPPHVLREPGSEETLWYQHTPDDQVIRLPKKEKNVSKESEKIETIEDDADTLVDL